MLKRLLTFLDRYDNDDDNDEPILRDTHTTRETIPRSGSLLRIRWQSEYLRNLAMREGSFITEYRLDPGGFDILCELLRDDLKVDQRMASLQSSKSGSDLIGLDSRVGSSLIILAGGRHMEAMRTHGISESQSYVTFKKFVRAVNKHPALDINFRTDLDSCKLRANGFKHKSQNHLFQHCVGAIDGIGIQTSAPKKRKFVIPNQASYYSGSKGMYMHNVLAVCDADMCFAGLTCKHPGGTNDIDAFQSSGWPALLDSLPFPYHLIGDGAFQTSATMISPFPGVGLHLSHPHKETFNWFQSSLRIIIECTFGLFIQVFGIFWKQLDYDVDFQVEIITCCFRLHNFRRKRRIPVLHVVPGIAAVDQDGRLVDERWRLPQPVGRVAQGGSALREKIVEKIIENGYVHVRSHNAGRI